MTVVVTEDKIMEAEQSSEAEEKATELAIDLPPPPRLFRYDREEGVPVVVLCLEGTVP